MNNLIKRISFLVLLFALTSCSSTSSSNTKVALYPKDFKTCNCIIINLYSKGDYELLIPLTELTNFINFYSDSYMIEYFRDIDSLVNHTDAKNKIIQNPLICNGQRSRYFCLGNKSYFLLLVRLFQSGNYYIRNTKTNKSVESVRVKTESWYSGPLAASYDVWVYIDGFIFWEDHTQA